MNPIRRSLVYVGLGLAAGVRSPALASPPRPRSAAPVEFAVIHDFDEVVARVEGNLTLGPDGLLYGVCNALGRDNDGVFFRLARDSTGFSLLYDFADSPGSHPAGLTLGADGLLYGLTPYGKDFGPGVIYRLTLDGKFTALLESLPWVPDGQLLQASDGRWYGVTVGQYNGGPDRVFRMPPDCSEAEVVHEFTQAEGISPHGLVEARNGLIYGTAWRGGTKDKGTIYSMTPDGQLTVLHSFENDGRNPLGLALGPQGLLFGSTAATKPKNHHPNGTLFSINRKGSPLTTVFDFPDSLVDGTYPLPMVRGRDGNFYGATRGGGRGTDGTLFRMSPDGAFETLFRFNGTSDGGVPYCRLAEGADGEFFGATQNAGANGRGTIFRLKV